MTSECKIIKKNAQPTMIVRTRSSVKDLPQVLGRIFGKIFQYIQNSGAHPNGAPYVAYYNMDMESLDIEIGIPVVNRLQEKDEIIASEIPNGKYAEYIHVGPYNKLKESYIILIEWMKENNYNPMGVAYEIYLDDPGDMPSEKLRTQILFPTE